MNVMNVVRKNLEPIILGFKINVWDILFEKEGDNKFLRVYIFKNNGVKITLDDCEMVSNAVSKKLDEIDVIKERYYLEVSSIGTERKLTKENHFLSSIGETVHIKFKKPYGGKRHLKGILKNYKDGEIEIETEDELFSFSVKQCLYVKINELEKNN